MKLPNPIRLSFSFSFLELKHQNPGVVVMMMMMVEDDHDANITDINKNNSYLLGGFDVPVSKRKTLVLS